MVTQSHSDKIAAANEARTTKMAEAARAHVVANEVANKEWVGAVKPIVDAKDMTVDEVSSLTGVHRTRIYQLFRNHPLDSAQETSST